MIYVYLTRIAWYVHVMYADEYPIVYRGEVRRTYA